MIWLLVALFTYRITRLVTTDSITEPIRNRLLARWPSEDSTFGDDWVTESSGEPVTVGGAPVAWLDGEGWIPTRPSKWGELITCPWCASFWVGVLVSVGLWLAGVELEWWQWGMLPFGLSAISGLLSGWE
jgi:hypothetical protein